MEVYVAVAGEHKSQERWREDLSAQFFPIYENGKMLKTDDDKVMHRRLLVAPIQLYKVCFNKENLPLVMDVLGTSKNYVLERYKPLKLLASMVRKALKLKAVPKPKNPNPLMQPEKVQKAVAVIPIGIKEDNINCQGQEHI